MGKAPILIADPDARVASLAAHALRREGMEVLVAHRGEDALAMLAASPPSLALCEVALPGIDGWALCENARREPATREVPFFLLTRRADRAERERAASLGADDLLAKPLFARDVVTLARLFGGRRSGETFLQGALEELPLFYLLRALTSGVRSGELQAPEERGVVHFRDGKVVEAAAGELTAEAALSRLLVLAKGPFTLKLGPVLLRGSLSYSLRELVTHDEPRRRRFEKAVAMTGGPDARLVIDFSALKRELPRLPASIEKVVRLFDGTRTLGEALRASDLEELTSAEAVLRLRMVGVLVPKGAEPAVAPPGRGEIKLFEPRNDEALLEMRKLFPEGSPAPSPIETAPREIRDWLEDIAERSAFQELLAVKDGGWVAEAATEAGKHLRQLAGEGAASDIDRQIQALDGPAPAAASPGSAAAASPGPAAAFSPGPAAAVAPATCDAPAPAGDPTPAPPAPAPEQVAVAGDPDEEQFFNSAPVFDRTTGRLASVLVVIGCMALGVGGVIAFKYFQQRRARSAIVVVPETPIVPAPDSPQPPAATPAPEAEPDPAAAATPTAPESPAPPDAPGAEGTGAAGAQAGAAGAASPEPQPEPKEPDTDVSALLARGRGLYERGQAEAALEPLEEAAAATENADVLTYLALARLDAGKSAEAEAAARRAVEIDPENARAHLALGSVLQSTGRFRKARAEFETYLRLEPRGKHAAEVRSILGAR